MQLWRVRTCTLSLFLSLSHRTLRLPQPESQPVSNTQCVLKSGLAWAQGGTVSFQGREAEAPVTEQPWWILKLLDSLCGSWFYKAEMAAKSACNPKTQPPPICVDIGIVEGGGVGGTGWIRQRAQHLPPAKLTQGLYHHNGQFPGGVASMGVRAPFPYLWST